MPKPLALSIAACLGLAGCNVFEKSDTWTQAVRVRPAETTLDADPSQSYATKLHEAFAADGIEHKVVVYQYHYTTRQREEAVGTRTAIVYRDNSNAQYPWWLKDDRLNKPVWLPNGSLDQQVSFYIRRKAEVIEVKEYAAKDRAGKTTVAFSRPEPTLRSASEKPSETGLARFNPFKKITIPFVTRRPVPAPAVAQAEPASSSLDPIASRGNDAWTPPAALDFTAQPSLTAPHDEHLETLFRAKHGTDYNRFSPTDRRKMQDLQNGVASRE